MTEARTFMIAAGIALVIAAVLENAFGISLTKEANAARAQPITKKEEKITTDPVSEPSAPHLPS